MTETRNEILESKDVSDDLVSEFHGIFRAILKPKGENLHISDYAKHFR